MFSKYITSNDKKGNNMRVAAINDLSGLGKCSLVSDITAFSAMGIEVCPVPTAVLSAQTGFSTYYCKDLTETIPKYTEKYREQNLGFDGIITGFMLNEQQANASLEFIRSFKKGNTKVLVDPVLGDDGQRYMNFSNELLSAMKELVKEADVITPNMTELFLLADVEPEKAFEQAKNGVMDYLLEVAAKVRGDRKLTIVVTGIPLSGEREVGNLVIKENEYLLLKSHTNGVHYSGTGDFFAAVLFGGILLGKEEGDAARLAGEFIKACVADAEEAGTAGIEGIAFEKHLGMLIQDK